MANIPVYGMMEKLQRSYSERRYDLVEILGIDINRIMHQLSDVQSRNTWADYDRSDTTIKAYFVR